MISRAALSEQSRDLSQVDSSSWNVSSCEAEILTPASQDSVLQSDGASNSASETLATWAIVNR